MPLFDTNYRLSLTRDGFKQQKSLFRAVEIKWREIRQVIGLKRAGPIYPDNYLIVKAGLKSATLSETDAEFRNFEPHLFANLPDFPSDWYELIEAQPFNAPLSLWERHR